MNMNGQAIIRNPIIISAGILALGFVVMAIIGAYTFYQVRSFDNTLSVTGSAKTRVTADSVKWTFNISRTVTEEAMQSGYAQLARDLVATKTFLTQRNVAESEVTISPVFMEEIYKYSPTGDTGPREYTLRQQVIVQSSDVERVTAIAKDTQELVNKGVRLSSQYPEYFYSKLADLRVSLLSDAVKDAKARAKEIAESSGQSVGSLKAASSGVVQVLSPNSVEVSDYGQYDTGSIEKDVMVTVRATFFVK